MKNFIRWCAVSFVGAGVWLIAQSPASAADVSFYGIIKGQSFIQDNPVAPVLNKHEHDSSGQDRGALFFNVFVELTASNVVQNASLTIPGGTVTNLLLSSDGMQKRIEVEFESKTELDARFPNGTYTLTMQGDNDGNKSVTMALTGDTYPNPPRISNYAAAQAVTGSSFTLSWDAFTGGSAGDFVEVSVEEKTQFGENQVYQSPNFGETGALDGTSTSVLVTNLSAGKVYTARLMFAKGVTIDTTSYGSGVTGITAYTKETEFTIRTTGGSEADAPFLEKSTPADPQGVARNSLVAFHFSEPMQTVTPGDSITWSENVTAANFSYTWSADGTSLFCKYNTDLPPDATISWTLNPNGSSMNFRDVAGNQLSSNTGGQFGTGNQTPSVTDVRDIFLVKARAAFTMDGTPVDTGIFQFSLSSDLTGHNTVTNGTLSIPGGAVLALSPDENYGDAVDFEGEYASQTDLNSFFPSGIYTVGLNTAHEGAKGVSLTLTGDAYPAFPTIASFSGTQSVDSSNTFTLQWSGFTGGTANDAIIVEIENQYGQEVFESGGPGEPGALDGTATQVTIPANTLAPGRTYSVSVKFIKVVSVDTSSYVGVTGAAVYAAVTEFELMTAGQTLPPRLSVLPLNSGNFQLRVTGEKGFPYTIEATEDFVNWQFVWTENAWSNPNGFEATIDFTDWSASNFPHRFYRAKEGSGDYNPGPQDYVSLEGTVRNANNQSILIQGAIVTTSLDGQSTMTDSSGHFFLQTTTPANYSSTPYTVTVTASGYQTFMQTTVWGDHPTGLFIDLNSNP